MDSVIDFTQLALQNIWTYGASFVLVMGLLVFIHEWGHFIVARLCGIRVEVFSIGFGKEIYGWTDKVGTRWKIAMIPLGGYVKMFGDSDPASAGHSDEIEVDGHVRHMTEVERSVAFFSKPVWKRSAVVFAGPAINFVFAIIVLSGLYMTQGRPIVPPQVTGVEVGSGAESAGFKPHDIIKAVNGKDIDSFREIQRAIMLTIDSDVTFVVERAGQTLNLTAHPKTVTEYDRFGFAHEKGYLGLMGPANGIDVTQIAKVDDVEVKGDIARAHEALVASMGKEIRVTTELLGEPYEFIIQPPMELNKQLLNPEDKEYNALFLGVKPGDEVIHYNPIHAVGVAIQETWRITADTLKAIGEIVSGTRSTKELGGYPNRGNGR